MIDSPSASPPRAKQRFLLIQRAAKGNAFILATSVLMVGIALIRSFSTKYMLVDYRRVITKFFDGSVRQRSPTMALSVTSSLSAVTFQEQLLPRIVYLEEKESSAPALSNHTLEDDPTMHAPPGEGGPVWQDSNIPGVQNEEDGCIPIADWQSKSFPNCNCVHEMDLNRAFDLPDDAAESVGLLGTGYFRSTWRWYVEEGQHVALKTLRFDRDFSEHFYDLHRRDAVAMERLTSSDFVVDIYGHCGLSVLNELADFQFETLQKFDRSLRGKRSNETYTLKLQLARSVAAGVADIHGIDDRPSMVHNDVNPSNVVVVAGGKPKLNDFNIAEFLRYNPNTNQTCGFTSLYHEPWWRAPEEVTVGNSNLLDEKVDIYALGNLLYHIMTTTSPRGQMTEKNMPRTQVKVAQGIPPRLHREYVETKEPALIAIRTAMVMCFEPDPRKRPSSRQVADMLMHAANKSIPV